MVVVWVYIFLWFGLLELEVLPSSFQFTNLETEVQDGETALR